MTETSTGTREPVNPRSLPRAPGWSQAVRAGGFVFGSGIMATDFETGLLAGTRPPADAPFTAEEPLGLEARVVLESIVEIMRAAGGDARTDLIRVWQWFRSTYPPDDAYARSRDHWPIVPKGDAHVRAYRSVIRDGTRTSTGIGIASLPVPDALLSVDFMAVSDGRGAEKQRIDAPEGVPQPHLGYCPGVRHGDWVFLSGFGSTDFAGSWMSERHMGEHTMIAPEARVNPYVWIGSEIEAETRFALRGLERMAEAAGTSLDRCVRADVTICHPSDFAGMDRVWREFFPDLGSAPARSVVTGAQLVQKGTRVEIAMVLLAGDSDLERRVVRVDDGPVIAGHAPQAVHAGELLFASTLLPIDESLGVPPTIAHHSAAPRVHDRARAQTERIIAGLERLCDAAGATLREVCKVHALVSDIDRLPGMLTAWRDAFPSEPPALSVVGAGGSPGLLVPGALVQWDAVVHAPMPPWRAR